MQRAAKAEIEFIPVFIPGCLEIRPRIHEDERGIFVKVFHAPTFRRRGLEVVSGEEFYTISKKGALRGLHFHMPPHDHAKYIYCANGAVLDAVLDLRLDSPTYGRYALFELGPSNRSVLYVPSGLAHGFYTLSDNSLMVYKTTTPYSPKYDAGIRWDSVGIPWPSSAPILSARDRVLPPLSEFKSPFSLMTAK